MHDDGRAGDEVGEVRARVERLITRTLAKLPRAASKSDREFLTANAKELVTHLEARGSRHAYEAHREEARSAESKVIDQTSAAGERVNDMAAAMVTLGRRTASVWARSSWVSWNSSLPTRSWVTSSQRHSRSRTLCT